MLTNHPLCFLRFENLTHPINIKFCHPKTFDIFLRSNERLIAVKLPFLNIEDVISLTSKLIPVKN